MKFYVVVTFYLVNLSVNFPKDPCINVRARVVNARVHVLLRLRAFTNHFRALNANISSTKARMCMVVNYYLVSLSFKFHEDSLVDARTNVVNTRAHVLS